MESGEQVASASTTSFQLSSEVANRYIDDLITHGSIVERSHLRFSIHADAIHADAIDVVDTESDRCSHDDSPVTRTERSPRIAGDEGDTQTHPRPRIDAQSSTVMYDGIYRYDVIASNGEKIYDANVTPELEKVVKDHELFAHYIQQLVKHVTGMGETVRGVRLFFVRRDEIIHRTFPVSWVRDVTESKLVIEKFNIIRESISCIALEDLGYATEGLMSTTVDFAAEINITKLLSRFHIIVRDDKKSGWCTIL